MDFKLELVLIPVTDVDRAKDFYTWTAGFAPEVDGPAAEGARIVQVTPPGSACSVGFGTGLSIGTELLVTVPPGSQRGLHLVVGDGPDPQHRSHMSFAEFSDPGGNTWLLQEVHRHDALP